MSTPEAGMFDAFMDDYFAECDEHIANIRRSLLTIEAAGGTAVDLVVVEELFRSFHSIKGISGMVELREAEMLAHHMESYLRALRERDAQLTGEGLDALITGVDVLERTIAARREAVPPPANDRIVAQLVEAIADARAVREHEPQVEGQPAVGWSVTFVPSGESIARGLNVDTVRARLRNAATIVDAVPKVLPDGIAFEFRLAGEIDEPTIERWRADGLAVERVSRQTAGRERETSHRSVQPSHVIRVDLTRLDDLMRMIGDLVITRARLDESLKRVAPHVPAVEWRDVQENAITVERQLRDLREGVVRVRMVPISEIFKRMPFVVRDLARDLDKKVRLELEGQDTEIDKYLIERMVDPVLHLVRNAVSHGFESAAERQRIGKPAEGTLRLAAAGIGDSVMLEVADDGFGIDVETVAARARAMGLPVPSTPLDNATVLDLICTPGFSTREETDRAAGRGVGMSVVKNTIQELNGTLTLETARGEGTRFIIELPLTLAIADALIATVGDRTFALPQSAVREVLEVDPAGLRRVEHQEIAPFRDGVLPIIRLSRLFGIEPVPRAMLHVFVIGSGRDAVGLAVDRIVGQREIVVRTMGDSLVKVDGVVGATDLGDGRVVLILDPGTLARGGRRHPSGVRAS